MYLKLPELTCLICQDKSRRPYRASAGRAASAISNLYMFFARPHPSSLFMSILLRESNPSSGFHYDHLPQVGVT